MSLSRSAVAAMLALGSLITPLVPRAEQPGRVYSIGVLSHEISPPADLEAFQKGLRELGYIEGKNLVIESRTARGKNERLAALADELVRLNVDIIVTVNTPAAQAAKNATTTIPIVVTRIADPVKAGLVSSLAQPGRNLTGLSSSAVEVAPKQLQLLTEILPRISRVALLWNAENPAATIGAGEMEKAAAQISLQVLRVPVRVPSDFPSAFQAATRASVEALVLFEDLWLINHRLQIISHAARYVLPVMSLYRDFPEAGGLLSYGTSARALYRRAAFYVDRILKGTRPRDLPIEQPTTFELVINMRTARALGLTIPPSVLARADQIIE